MSKAIEINYSIYTGREDIQGVGVSSQSPERTPSFWYIIDTLTIAQLVKNPPSMQETLVQFWVGKVPWRRDRLPTPILLGFPCDSAGKEFACNAGDPGLIPALGRSTREGIGYPLQYSWGSPVAPLIKNLPAMRETWV